MKRNKELESVNWVKAQAAALSKKRAESMARFIAEELGVGLANRQKEGIYSATEVDTLIEHLTTPHFPHQRKPLRLKFGTHYMQLEQKSRTQKNANTFQTWKVARSSATLENCSVLGTKDEPLLIF
jgi:hypothetical protein